MVGISNAVFGKQPNTAVLNKNNGKPVSTSRVHGTASGTAAGVLRPPLSDDIHFEGRRRKTSLHSPSLSESETEDSGYSPSSSSEEGESDTSVVSSSGETNASSSEALIQDPASRHQYNLRKRPKMENGVSRPYYGEESDTAVSTSGRQAPDTVTFSANTENAENESLGPKKRAEADKAFTQFVIALFSQGAPKGVNGPNAANGNDSDDDNGADPPKVKVISYKQSPFGPKEPRLGFQRIAGMADLKSDLNRLLVDQIKNPQLYKDYGLQNTASGVLLYGPPGNGKTFFAKAVAEEAGANFVEIHPSTIASPYIHETSKFIGEAFDAAADMARKTKKPTVMLIDEVDAVAPQRAGDSHSNYRNEEVAEFLNQLNECAQKNVFVVATTNLPDMLDPALVRSGRMNAKIYVGAPDEQSRGQVLQQYLKQRSPQVLDEGLDVSALAKKTQGYSIADLKELVNQAARFALQQRAKMDEGYFKQALKTVKPSVSNDMPEVYKQMIEKFEVQTTDTNRDEAWKNMYI